MAVFPIFQMPLESTKLRFKEPFGSEAINQKFAGIVPVGIYRGYDINPQPNFQLFINTDAVSNDSVAVVELATFFNLTVRTTQQVVLDFSGHTTFPVFVALRANYSINPNPFSGVTDAKIVTVTSLAPGDIPLCVVTGIGFGNTPTVSTVIPTERLETGGLATFNGLPFFAVEHLFTAPVQTVPPGGADITGSTLNFNTTVPGDVIVFGTVHVSTDNDNSIQVIANLDGVNADTSYIDGGETDDGIYRGPHAAGWHSVFLNVAPGPHVLKGRGFRLAAFDPAIVFQLRWLVYHK